MKISVFLTFLFSTFFLSYSQTDCVKFQEKLRYEKLYFSNKKYNFEVEIQKDNQEKEFYKGTFLLKKMFGKIDDFHLNEQISQEKEAYIREIIRQLVSISNFSYGFLEDLYKNYSDCSQIGENEWKFIANKSNIKDFINLKQEEKYSFNIVLNNQGKVFSTQSVLEVKTGNSYDITSNYDNSDKEFFLYLAQGNLFSNETKNNLRFKIYHK